jgi:hypothetical protein
MIRTGLLALGFSVSALLQGCGTSTSIATLGSDGLASQYDPAEHQKVVERGNSSLLSSSYKSPKPGMTLSQVAKLYSISGIYLEQPKSKLSSIVYMTDNSATIDGFSARGTCLLFNKEELTRIVYGCTLDNYRSKLGIANDAGYEILKAQTGASTSVHEGTKSIGDVK